MISTLLHFILSTLSNTPYSHCQVYIPNLYKHLTARACGLNRLDGTMTVLQDINWAKLHTGPGPSSCRLTCIERAIWS